VEQNVHTTFSLPNALSGSEESVLGMFKDSAIILDVIRRSFLTKSATAAMFTQFGSILDGHHPHHLLPAPFRLKTENTT
jgi:hypothetical protein